MNQELNLMNLDHFLLSAIARIDEIPPNIGEILKATS